MTDPTPADLDAVAMALGGVDLTREPASPLRDAVVVLVNLIERLAAENRTLRAENQQLRDEIARLKGEQGRPDVKGNRPPPSGPVSSERERKTSRSWTKSGKRDRLRIDRVERREVDRFALPADAVFKGYAPVVVQDLLFRVETIQFEQAVWYSPSERRTYQAALPAGYHGQFGPAVKSFVLALGSQHVSQETVQTLLADAGVRISAGTIAGWLTHDLDRWQAEVTELATAALRGSPWQTLDDTLTRINGQNAACQVLTSPLATVYHTTAAKDRETVVDVLRLGQARVYQRTAEADQWFAAATLSVATRQALATLPADQRLTGADLDAFFREQLPTLGATHRKLIRDTLAIAAYHADPDWPVIQLLLTDAAPQFAGVTAEHALCWVHEGRAYKKLVPFLPLHRTRVADTLGHFWAYYCALRAYQVAPTADEADRLREQFDVVFGATTGYLALDERLALTRAKKAALLQVLDHPEVPLHTNAAEQAVRRRVRKRDISFGPRTLAGARAWDTFQTLAATAAQYGISFFRYLHDRLTARHAIPPLANLVTARAAVLKLGTSWAGS